MKLALFGATGHIGRHVLRMALEQGHQVTALVRDRARIDAHTATTAHIVSGSLENPATVRYAIEGSQAVIATLAAGNGVLQSFDSSALPVLHAYGPRRIVSLVGASVRMPGDPRSLALSLMTAIMRIVPGRLLQDAEGHAHRLAASGLDWTLVRAANFSSAPPTGRIRATIEGEIPLSATITEEDLAAFILEVATTGRHMGEAPMVWNG